LFYLPDSVRPWPDQRVGWVLRMVEGLFGQVPGQSASVIERLGLGPLVGACLRTLSKGEHRRVMLAVGLIAPQPILLLDEPFDGLDLRQTREVMAVLREHAGEGRSLLLSIHQLTDAGRVADRLVLLSAGSVVGEGTLSELRDAAQLPGGSVEEVFLALT
jgi:ABC-2 type transport system ATP-binding protein